MISILWFILVLGVLVFIHELGHFLVAKKVGIRAEKFSLGFPPNIFEKKWGETTYCIGMLPLGGYVKMAGETPGEESSGAPYEFMSKTVLQRMAVIFAGPFMNYVLAIFIMILVFMFSGKPIIDTERSMVGEVMEGSPALEAGLETGDQVLSVDGEAVTDFESMRLLIAPRPTDTLFVTWLRGKDTLTANIVPELSEQPTLDGSVDSIGRIGVGQMIIGSESFGFFGSIKLGVATTHQMIDTTVSFLKMLVTGQASTKMLGGPIFIARQSGKEAQKGIASLLVFMALLSINLAILNVLPIPVLDGGHLLFLLIEAVKGSPVSMKVRMVAQQVGIVVLLGLMVFVTYNDIIRWVNS